MTLLLLLVIYIAYIGLGIPDSLFGTAWPAIYTEFEIPISYSGFVTSLISGGTIVSSLCSARLIHRFGTARVAAVSTAMTAIALTGFSVSCSFWWLCLCAIPLGLGAGSIDTALNNYVALHYSASQMSFLHCFYGIGISLSPYLLSRYLTGNNDWRGGYRMMAFIQFLITLVMFGSFPLWKKVEASFRAKNAAHLADAKGKNQLPDDSERVVPMAEMLHNKKTLVCMLILIGSCGIESVCMNWGSTFLVNSKGVSAGAAAQIMTFYFVGLMLGRFCSGLLANRLSSMKIIRIGESLTFAAILIVLISNSTTIAGIGLFLVGVGNGPVFPNMTHLIPQIFGRDVSQSYIGLSMSASYVSILLSPVLFGLLAQNFSTGLFPAYLLALFLIAFVFTEWLRRETFIPAKQRAK